MFFNNRWQEQEKTNIKVNQQIVMIDKSLDTSFSRLKEDISHINQWINYLHKNQDRVNDSLVKIDAKFENLLTKEELRFFVDQYYKDLDSMNNSFKTTMESSKNEIKGYVNTVYTNQKDIFQRLQMLSEQVYSQSKIKSEIREDILDTRREVREVKSEINAQLQYKIQEQLQLVCRREIDTSVLPIKEEFTNFRREIDEKMKNTVSKDVFERLESLNTRLDNMNSSIGTLQQKTDTKQNLKEKIFKNVTRHSKDYIKSMLLSYIKKYGKISGLQLREIVVEEQGLASKSSFYRLLIELEEDDSVSVVHEGKEKHYFFAATHLPHTM